MAVLKRLEDAAMRVPRLWDFLVRAYPRPANPGAYALFHRFSRARNGRVTFVQIGASDGMRCDPIREFVVRDGWRGVLVEPLPEAFRMLRESYAYLPEGRLRFVQAGISDTAEPLELWTYTEAFLGDMPIGDRMYYLRKSSFDRAHVAKHAGVPDPSAVIERVRVPVMTLDDLIARQLPGTPPDVIVIDAEGHEGRILGAADLEALGPELIFFESHNLGGEGDALGDRLRGQGYRLEAIGGDTAAIREG